MVGVVDLLDRARQTGLVVLVEGDRVVVRGPKRLAALAEEVLEHAQAVRDALRAEAVHPQAPTEACLGCGALAWTWCAGWPEPGAGRWLCRTCMHARQDPPPSLTQVVARLSADERRQLEAEAAGRDPLARVVVDLLAEADATIPPTVSDDTADATASWARRNGYRTKREDFDADGRHKATPPDFDTLVPARGWVERGAELAAWQARLETRTKGEMPDHDGRPVPAREVFLISTTNTESTTTATEAVQGELEALAGRREAQLPK